MIASDASNYTVSGTLRLYADLKSLGVEEEYLKKLEEIKDDSLKYHVTLTNALVDKIRKGQKEQLEQESERAIRGSRARDIHVKIMGINAAFKKLTGQTIFREDISGFFTEISIKCSGYPDFKNKLENLCCLFEVNLDGLRSTISNPEPEWKSRKILSEWLKEKKLSGYDTTIAVWNKICCLRNMPPTHPKMSKEHLDALIYFGAYLDDCPRLWDAILDRFLRSLDEFLKILRPML